MCICVCICICYLYTDHILGNRYIYIYIGTQAAGQLEQGLQPYLSILTIYYLSIQLGSWNRPFNPAGTRLERKKCGAPIPEKGNLKMSRFSVCIRYMYVYTKYMYIQIYKIYVYTNRKTVLTSINVRMYVCMCVYVYVYVCVCVCVYVCVCVCVCLGDG